MMSVIVDYYMTLNSPWTYLGSALFAEIASRNRATVNIKPCKFGAIFEQTGGLPLPKRSPQRRAYRMMELKRWRDVRGISLTPEPKHFPATTLPRRAWWSRPSCEGRTPTDCRWSWVARYGSERKHSPTRQRSQRPLNVPVSTPRAA